MTTRLRFRTGSWARASDAAMLALGRETLWFEPEELTGIEPAQPGDCWRVRWGGDNGGLAGYAICCPRCLQVHTWTSAASCMGRALAAGQGACQHNGVSSCWQWTGLPEDGTLTAEPSLHCDSSLGGCGWHGWLRAGVLSEC